MNKLLSILTFSFFVGITISCSPFKEEGFTIHFQLDDVPDCNFFVSERVPDSESWFIDTLQLKNGESFYRGRVEYPKMTNFYFAKGQDVYGTLEVFLDNSKNIIVKGKNVQEAQVSGCKSHDDYLQVKKHLADEIEQIRLLSKALSKEYRGKKDPAIINQLKTDMEKAETALTDKLLETPHYATSRICPYFIYKHFMGRTDALEKALSKVDTTLDNNGYVKAERAELLRQKRSAVGQPAFQFCLKDIEGKEYKLSDFKGKYVLLEFSASWCGWCKKEIPYLKQVYEEHKDNDNFVMLTINLDTTREKWETDVKEENLPWPVISDLKAFKGEVAEGFNIHGIPMIYLINQEGNIEKKGLRGNEMILTIRQYLKK